MLYNNIQLTQSKFKAASKIMHYVVVVFFITCSIVSYFPCYRKNNNITVVSFELIQQLRKRLKRAIARHKIFFFQKIKKKTFYTVI